MSWWVFGRNRSNWREVELDSELHFHLQQVIDTKVAEGVKPEEARRQALLEFGGNEQVKEECRDVHRIATVENAISNLKAAVRFIRKAPGFALTVMLTLALGIGVNSAVFSAIDAVVLRTLPYRNSGQLMLLHQYTTKGKSIETNVSTRRLEDWSHLSMAFTGITGYYMQDISETSGALPEKLSQALVAPRFLQVLGMTPSMGRDFTVEEEHFGGPSAVLISDALWRRRFHGDLHAVGQKLHFGRYAYTIIGVMPPYLAVPNGTTDLWSISAPDAPFAQDRQQTWFFVIGRLKQGISIQQGRANLTAVQAQLARQYPATDKDVSVGLETLKHSIVGTSGRSLWLLFGAVSLLLLIACANIAALLLARTSERAREIAIRYSLGASRPTVIVQLLTESLALVLIGSTVGLLVALAASTMFRSLARALPRANEIHLDWRIVVYATTCAFVCTLLFGLVPALEATRRTIAGTLSGNSPTQIAGSSPVQWVLVATQVALAVTLLLGAALLLRSFQALGRVQPGFDIDHILTLRLSGSWGETADMKGLIRRIDHDLDAIRSVPGVAAAATSASLPGTDSQYPGEFKLAEGNAVTDKIASDQKAISAGYFETMRIPILNGRPCSRETTWNTVLVNRSFVRSFLGGQPAIGRHLRAISDPFLSGSRQIIGIAEDARENGLGIVPMPTVYSCISAPDPSPVFSYARGVTPDLWE